MLNDVTFSFRFTKYDVVVSPVQESSKKAKFKKRNFTIFRNISFYQICHGRDLHLRQAEKTMLKKRNDAIFRNISLHQECCGTHRPTVQESSKKTKFKKRNVTIFRNISFFQICRGRDLHLRQAEKNNVEKTK